VAGQARPLRRSGLVVLAAVVLGAAFASLLTRGGGSTVSPVRATDGGPTLTVAVPALPTNLNVLTPAGHNAVTEMVTAEVWPQPFVVGPQLAPVLDRVFVTSAELVSLAPQTVVYRIARGARWSNGAPITAADFAYLWRELRHGPGPGIAVSPGLAAGYADIVSVTGSDSGRTVTVVFRHPYADWEALFAHLLPAEVADRVGWDGFAPGNRRALVAGGPFELARFVPGRELVLRRNPRYWGPPAPIGRVVFLQLPEQDDATALASGLVQVAVGPADPSVVAAVKAIPGVESAVWGGLRFEQLDFNLRNRVLANPVVRKALALATDRTQLLTATVGTLDPGLGVDDNHLFVPGQPDYTADAGPYDAVHLLSAEADFASVGLTMGTDGYLHEPGGAVFTLPLLVQADPLDEELAGLLSEELRSAGVAIDVVAEPPGPYGAALASGRFALALVVAKAALDPVSASALYGTPGPGSGSRNVTGFSDPRVDALLASAAGELDPVRAKARYTEVDDELWSAMVSLPLFQLPEWAAFSDTVVGVGPSAGPSGIFWNAASWSIRPVVLPPQALATTTTTTTALPPAEIPTSAVPPAKTPTTAPPGQ
jgi:peptide/nickel transport system substrate-binding protein